MDAAAIAAFLDRQAAIAVVAGYATALDARDWPGYRALFADTIAIDYAAIGSITATISADDWTDRCRTLEGFNATAHQLHNLDAVITGDTAVVTSIVDAQHFVAGTPSAQLIGRYRHDLRRSADAWLITGVTLAVIGYPTGRPAFDACFAAARAIFAERHPA
ncbi:hypothetical protein GCM10011529_07800 [Polymorphobacter glacialis]|uniref:SnoaL-like domain-containing protein n=1 Tax=Sandarakinorhabdus glacialis TaxID=1614636 RepID=A0A917E6C8_9SPHN|nr:nuclear transport factor 2 family protein [Polymorphobacter glacialis]GGE03789.1 hypothetical protein GCM10011529_07800 [Polymorphobacter glacialis]